MTAAEKRWRAQVDGWARSGLSCTEYAAKVGVHPGTLAGWKSKLRHAENGAASFVEVTEQVRLAGESDAGELELVLGRVHVRVRGRVDAEALARVLDVLEARA